jgi:phosphopantetheinyl transferase
VSGRELTALTVSPSAPQVRLLDALDGGLDATRLQAWAREETAAAAAGASHASRSYRYPYALVSWHTEAVGVDIERVQPFDRAFMESICTPSERLMWSGDEHSDEFLSSLWSSKEALAKALGDARAYDPRRLDSPMRWPDGQSGPWRAAPLMVPAGHVAWLCWRSTGGQ